ncbi:50S ribosomal protein L10 [Candidatus Propionivibrio aalborgensis]|uniref:50S ribosomal protein L10 n=1 Tax=Candidatus Propionivibrio aalborgensis TaxID=1860101 RepID=A0A1A8XTN6_9RHOO|nr:50S ribosomal protein L10 [Candidatus Propionivibrio aalborgensis]SBT08425.1 50S ribosomal protein L10 [Candidatus Propionivibrio aalborgensis]
MGLNLDEKKAVVAEVLAQVATAEVIVVAEYSGLEVADLTGQMTGPLIYGISKDPVSAARVLNDFAKTNEKLVLKAGSLAGKVLDKAGVQALASIPSREELLGKLLGMMQAPVTGFACALASLAKQREEATA